MELIIASFLVSYACFFQTAISEKPKFQVSKMQTSSQHDLSQSASTEVCARVCTLSHCTTYYCQDGICCTPGSPSSRCCPISYPLCMQYNKCCPVELPKLCAAKYCCKQSAKCCKNACCEATENCCGSEKCCSNKEKCCMKSDVHGECCDQKSTFCCGKLGCRHLCPSIFDVVPCLPVFRGIELEHIETNDEVFLPGKLYRLLRVEENPNALVAKNPLGTNSVEDHVLCGSEPDYQDQFISFTSKLFFAKLWMGKCQREGKPTGGIVEIETKSIPATLIYDLTIQINRDRYLKNDEAKRFAKGASEVLIALPPGTSLKTTVIVPPGENIQDAALYLKGNNNH